MRLRELSRCADAAVCTAAALVAVVMCFYNWRLYHQDADVFVLIARRLLAGEVIYRDFWMAYPPGRFFFYAGLMKLFGVSHYALKLSSIAIFSLLPPLLYLLLRRYTGIAAAAFSAALAIAAYPPSHKVFIPLFSVTTLWVMSSLARGATPLRLLAAGANIGLAAFFKHEIGAVLGVAVLACIVFAPGDGRPQWRRIPRRALVYAGGIGLVVVPTVCYLWSQQALAPMYDALIVAPFYAVSGMSLTVNWPFSMGLGGAVTRWRGELLSHVFYLGPVVYGGVLLWGGRPVLKRQRNEHAFFLFFAALVGLSTYVNAVGRTDMPHLRQAILPLFAVLGMILSGLARGLRAGNWGAAARGSAAIVILGYGAWFAATGLWGAHLIPSAKRLERMNSVPADLRIVTSYIEANFGPAETIFVTPRRMDVYNLTGRLNVFRYGDLFPGVFGRRPREEEAGLVEELRAKADVVVLYMLPWNAAPDRDELREYAPLVHAFIVEECRPVAKVAERYTILRRNRPDSGRRSDEDVDV